MGFSLHSIMSTIKSCIETLYPFLTDERKERFEEVLSKRTKYITIVLEDIFKGMNASAVMRSADGFGLQDLAAQMAFDFP